ncbi:NADH dehydrogenase [bacterium A37T11]|nr:NADH dehydrogenase [bacterium A37T11]
MESSLKKVVVVGGGFAGINLVKHLGKDKRFEITLLDKNNYHFFPPLIYQVATAFIEPSNIAYPFRRMFQKQDNIRFHMGSLLEVDTVKKLVFTDTGTLGYDILVLALGTETNYFGLDDIRINAQPMKTLDDAMNLRNQLLLNMERGVRATERHEKEKHLNIVIAGGGPTGVELAGMLGEMGKEIGAKEYPEIKNMQSHLYLVNAAPVLLPPMSEKSQQEAKKVLTKLGVNVVLDKAVKSFTDGQVILEDGQVIHTNMLIWTSGVIGREVKGLPAEKIARGRRIMVNAYNQVDGLPEVYAIGDIAVQTTDPKFPHGHPQLAQVAMQQGTLLAKNLIRLYNGKPLEAFKYKDLGSMAIIAKYRAVADLPAFFIRGLIAWLIWLFVHIIPLVGFRNKLKLAFSWMWSFLTNDPTLRLIFRPGNSKKDD